MRNSKTNFALFMGAMLSFAFFCHAQKKASSPKQPSAEDMILDLSQSDWWHVNNAKSALESHEAKAIPALLELMKRRERIPLTNTADLIYPGAKTFYGHGGMVNYDLDSLTVRAGWVLEELTFQDFGFSAGQIKESLLLQSVRENDVKDRPLSNVLPLKSAEEKAIDKAVASACAWWENEKKDWSRLKAIEEALSSTSPFRQLRALNYLRFGTTMCDGYEHKKFIDKHIVLLRKLAETGTEAVRVQAKDTISDS